MGLYDVDSRILDKVKKKFSDFVPSNTKTYSDIRKMLEEKSIDAVSIATPNHWHSNGYHGNECGKARLSRKTLFSQR